MWAFGSVAPSSVPSPTGPFDSVVVTRALCTIPDPLRAVVEAHRVLKLDGILLAREHVRAGEPTSRSGRIG